MKENNGNKPSLTFSPDFAVDIDNAWRGHTLFLGTTGAGKTWVGCLSLSDFHVPGDKRGGKAR